MEFNVGKLREDLVVQELAVHAVAMDVLECQVYKVAPFLVDDVVVTNELLALLAAPYFVESLQNSLRVRIYSNADFALVNEIHFGHLLVLFVHNTVYGVLGVEFAGHQAKREGAQEPLVCEEGFVEEPTELAEDVGE